MNRFLLAGVALACLPLPLLSHADDVSPSALMRSLPAIPADPQPADCAVSEKLLPDIEQRAMTDMMRVQQLAMAGMTAGGSRISDQQGKLIERLMDPAVTMCEMNALQVAGVDPESAYTDRVREIETATRAGVESNCPVTGMADYRDPACVDPIVARDLAARRQALAQFATDANERLRRDIDVAAQCAEMRERIADEAEAAKLPAQYLSMALGGRNSGWQQLGALAEGRDRLCETIHAENARLQDLENF